EGPDGVSEPPGVSRHHLDVAEWHTELVGHDLGEHRLVSLTLAGQPGRHPHPTARLDEHVAALVRSDAGALDIAPDADAHPPAHRPSLLAIALEVVPADKFLELLEQRRIITGVIDQRTAVLKREPLVIGHLVRLDEVARPHFGAVQA